MMSNVYGGVAHIDGVVDMSGAIRTPGEAGPRVEEYRAYLLLIANDGLSPRLRGKLGPSDLVQETFVEAQQALDTFRGTTPESMRAWLREILDCRLANIRRAYLRTKKRSIAREVRLDNDNGRTMRDAPCPAPSPSSHAIGRERELSLQRALADLPDHYRTAVDLRNRQGLSFREVGERMGRSEEAARKLWARGILELRKRVGGMP